MGQILHKPGEHFTYSDYLAWPNEERWELIDGSAYDMSPAPGARHQTVLLRLARQIGDYLDGKPCKAFIAPFDVLLPESDESDEQVLTVVQPDLLVVCDSHKIRERGCRGAPDFIVEIVSPTTSAKDQTVKVALYEHHGVKEYWIIHPADNLLTVRLLGEDGKYGIPLIREGKGRISSAILPEMEILLDAVFAA